MEGEVTDRREAVFTIVLQGADFQQLEVEAVLDTGFDDCLTLPAETIEWLSLPFVDTLRGTLADGSMVTFDVHRGTVLWHGVLRTIPVQAAATVPLIGMGLLLGSLLTVEVIDGGLARIEPL